MGRKAWGNFVDGDPHEDWDMPLDYFVWAIVGDGRTIVVDTGFDGPLAKKRDRKIVHPGEEGAWKVFDHEVWAAAATERGGLCTLISFRGTPAEMESFLRSLKP